MNIRDLKSRILQQKLLADTLAKMWLDDRTDASISAIKESTLSLVISINTLSQQLKNQLEEYRD